MKINRIMMRSLVLIGLLLILQAVNLVLGMPVELQKPTQDTRPITAFRTSEGMAFSAPSVLQLEQDGIATVLFAVPAQTGAYCLQIVTDAQACTAELAGKLRPA